jgi:hypothetical protein
MTEIGATPRNELRALGQPWRSGGNPGVAKGDIVWFDDAEPALKDPYEILGVAPTASADAKGLLQACKKAASRPESRQSGSRREI